jgi:predicted dehydrogenase
MTSSVPRVGVLGVEHYHANFWTRAFLQTENAQFVGIWDAEAERARDFGRAHGVDAFDDRRSLIDACDAVAICSATCDHAPLIEDAAARGRAVLCEKPLCHSVEDALRVREIVKRSRIPFMQSFPKRFDPVNHEILGHIRSGTLGRITLCRVRHGHSHGFNPDFRRAWFVDPARSGGGTLLDEGVHAADFLRWAFGEPESVWATTSSGALGLPVEDTAAATFRYADGLIAEVTTSWCFAAADASIEIYGTQGTILLSGVDIASRPTRDADFLRIYRREGEGGRWASSPTVPHFKTGVFHEHVAWTFADALRDGKPLPVDLEDGLRALVMIDAAYASARSGRAETIIYPT